MVYTSQGSALARVSLVDLYGTVHLDLMVKPDAILYDANTSFSGLTKEQVEAATETLETVSYSMVYSRQKSIDIFKT